MTAQFKTYDETLDYLFKFTNYENFVNFPYDASKLNLARMRGLLEFLGNPHLAPASVHITGTKGKGSTAMMLGAIAQKCGRRAGLYTSPHLVNIEERITVNGRMIPRDDLVEQMNILLPYLEKQKKEAEQYATPTFFEIFTAIAWNYFRARGVDLAIMEVGLGGRLDSTNIIAPAVCIITNVSIDHTRQLGGTVASIAREKAGIIKPGVPVVTAAQDADALAVFEEALERGLVREDDTVVLLATGSGLKDVESAITMCGSPFTVEPALTDVKRLVSGGALERPDEN